MTTTATGSGSREARVRLAVLPFVNLSGDIDREYFSDGLTEEMIARLGRIHPERLGVIARTSAQQFRNGGCPIDQIGRELHVRYVVEGSVQWSGDQVRIGVQLIDARDQTHLWSESYDRQLDDWFGIQSDVADRVARSLEVELLPQSAADADETVPASGEAYQLYLKGRFYWARWRLVGSRLAMEATHQAIGYFERAIRLDPTFARAQASLARAKAWQVEYSDKPARHILEEARRAAELAISLDPNLHWGYLARASVRKRLDWDWAGAEADYHRATALSPNCEAAHRSYAGFLAAMNRHPEALAETERATELDPLCLVVNASDACVRYFAGRLDEALASSRRVIEMDPEFSLAHQLLGATYLELDRPNDAVDEMKRAVEIEGRQPVALAWLGHALGAAGRLDDGRAVLAEVEQLATERYVSPYRVAPIHTGLGDIDAAFHGLTQACDERAVGLVNVAAEPRFAALRADPRYRVMLRRMGLEAGPRLVATSA